MRAPQKRLTLKQAWREVDRLKHYMLQRRVSPDRSREVVAKVLSLGRGPYCERFREIALHGSWDELVRFPPPEPSPEKGSLNFGLEYLASEILSKMHPVTTGADPADLVRVAMDKFYASEDQCRETNQRLTEEFKRLGSAELDPIVSRIQRKIARLLGRFSWDEAHRHFGHGKGATTRLPKIRGDRYYKFGDIPDSTKECETLSKIAISLIKPWRRAEPGNWSENEVKIVPGNRVTTVRKTAKTDRVIAKEPCMNIYIQRGIGPMIRKRLKRVGIDLNDQTRNNILAQEGSEHWEDESPLCTIDLSNASDTISQKVVELFLPPDWYEAMDACRSHYGVLDDGTCIRYQKFSTMGNGFTFELESLIFWAIASTCVDVLKCPDTRIGVYGDDLIVTRDAYELLETCLTRFGFTLNPKKSFSTGPFRESCGKHWFKGRDVSPFYIRKGVETVIDELLVVNNLRRWLSRVYRGFIPPLAWSIYTDVRDSLLPAWVVREYKIPDGFGDLGVVSSFEEALPQRAQHGLEGWCCDVLQETPTPLKIRKKNRKTGPSLLSKSLSKLEDVYREVAERELRGLPVNWYAVYRATQVAGEEPSDELPAQRVVLRLQRSKVVVPRWSDIGQPFS